MTLNHGLVPIDNASNILINIPSQLSLLIFIHFQNQIKIQIS
jgi:hypothetical protein